MGWQMVPVLDGPIHKGVFTYVGFLPPAPDFVPEVQNELQVCIFYPKYGNRLFRNVRTYQTTMSIVPENSLFPVRGKGCPSLGH